MDIAVFTGVGEARNAINVLSSDVVVACGVEVPDGIGGRAGSEARPAHVLLAPSTEAAAFFRTIEAPGSLYEVGNPEAAVEVIEHRLGIARWAISKT